jgi:hypothetical protein
MAKRNISMNNINLNTILSKIDEMNKDLATLETNEHNYHSDLNKELKKIKEKDKESP